MIKCELKNKNKISNNVLEDARCAKICTDELCLPIKGKITGFIQKINAVPFGYLCISDLQVRFLT